MQELDRIKDRFRQARNDGRMETVFCNMLNIAGAATEIGRLQKEGMFSTWNDTGDEMPDYPAIEMSPRPTGVQNHNLVDFRIVLDELTESEPDITFEIDDPTIKELMVAWVRKRWRQGRWQEEFYPGGMETLAAGFGVVQIGMEGSTVTLAHRSVLDVLKDPMYINPGKWRYLFVRNRLDVDEAFEKYGEALHEFDPTRFYDEESIRGYLSGLASRKLKTLGAVSSDRPTTQSDNVNVIFEFEYWDKDHHVVFLHSVVAGEFAFAYDEDMELTVAQFAGPNPFGIIPFSFWTDSWAPGVREPVSKADTSLGISSMLNAIEYYMSETLRRSLPMTLISTLGMDPKSTAYEKIMEGTDIDKIWRVIPFNASAKDVRQMITRVPAGEVPATLLQAHNMFSQYKNAATGVLDAQRGVIVGGERTAYEMQALQSNAGVQQAHLRSKYARFVEDAVRKARMIEGMFGDSSEAKETFYLKDAVWDTGHFPIEPLLQMPIEVRIRDESLRVKSEGQLVQERIFIFEHVDTPAMKVGVGNPMRIFESLYRDLGVKDPYSRLNTPEEMAAQAKQAMEQQMLAAQGAAHEGQAA